MTSHSSRADDSQIDARVLLDRFLSESHEDEPGEFEQFCEAHPGQEVTLRRLYLVDQRIRDQFLRLDGGQFEGTVSPAMDSGSTAGQLEELVSELKAVTPSGSRYVIGAEIARGGMGSILKVWDKSLRRTLAMKVALEAKGSTGPDAPSATSHRSLARFLDEAHITGQLDHPGIVPVQELGVDADGQVYFTMRLVKGGTLSDVFRKVKQGEDGWTEARALGVLLKVCEAMAYAHSKKVIHRDLKPANIMVGRFGEVYVMDWGLARVLGKHDPRDIRIRPTDTASIHAPRGKLQDESPDSPLVTMDGDVVGTPVYMSPEQARGDIAGMGPHSDVYALGAMLYQLLTGTMPYLLPGVVANKYAIWQRVQEGAPKPVHSLAPGASAEICSICEKAMARSSDQRYPEMSALADDLSAYIEGRVVRAHQTGAWAETKKWVTRNRALAMVSSAAVLLLVIGLASALWLRGEALASAARADQNALERTEQATLARTNQDEAERQASIALAISEFLNDDLLGAIDPDQAKHADVSLRDVVDQASERITDKFLDQPTAEAQLRQTLGFVYNKLGAPDEAIEHLEHAVRLFTEVESERSLSVAGSLFELAVAWGTEEKDFSRAVDYAQRAFDIRSDLLGPDDPLTVLAAADIAFYSAMKRGSVWASIDSPHFDLLFRISSKARGLDETPGEIRQVWMSELARMGAAWESGDRVGARKIIDGIADPFRDQLFLRDRMSWSAIAMARYLLMEGEEAMADCLGTVAGEIAVEQFGENNSWTARTIALLGALRRSQGRMEEAEACALRSFHIYQRLGGYDHDDTRAGLRRVGMAFREAGHLKEAEVFLRQILEELGEGTGLDETRAMILNELASTLHCSDSFSPKVMELTRQASALVVGKQGTSKGLRAELLLRTGRLHLRESSYEQAEQDMTTAWNLVKRTTRELRARRHTLQGLISLYKALDRPAEQATFEAILETLEASDQGRMEKD